MNFNHFPTMTEYDETKAISLMNEAAGANYPDDEILNIIDMIWDYYEQNGLLDPVLDDADTDDSASELADIVEYVKRMAKKDRHCKVSPDHIEALVAAELQYEESLADDEDLTI